MSIPETNLPTTSVETPIDERERVGSRVVIYRTAVSPCWQIQFNLNGRQFRHSLKTRSRKEARKLALAKDAQLVLGTATLPAPRGADLEKCVESFLEYVQGKDRGAQTVRLYRQYLEQLIDWAAAHAIRRLEQLDLKSLEAFQQAIVAGRFIYRCGKELETRTARPNSRRTVRSKMKTIRSVFRWALRRGVLSKDPAAGYELPPKAKDQAYCFTNPELVAIFNAAEQPYKDIFMFLAMTGLRVGELRFLTKADVDLEQGLVCVRAKEIKETGERWKPKHGNERIAPLSAKAREIVERHLTAATAPWVFEAPSGHGSKGGRFEYQRIRQALRRAKKAAGVEQGKVHSFRHAFCSHLAQQPHVTAFDAMKLMGHASLDIVVVYFHTTKERLCSVMSKVSFDSMLEGVPALSATSSPTE